MMPKKVNTIGIEEMPCMLEHVVLPTHPLAFTNRPLWEVDLVIQESKEGRLRGMFSRSATLARVVA
jgi:hypothetical protein